MLPTAVVKGAPSLLVPFTRVEPRKHTQEGGSTTNRRRPASQAIGGVQQAAAVGEAPIEKLVQIIAEPGQVLPPAALMKEEMASVEPLAAGGGLADDRLLLSSA